MSEVPYLLPQFSAVGTIINRMAYGDEIFNEYGQKILEMNLSTNSLHLTSILSAVSPLLVPRKEVENDV